MWFVSKAPIIVEKKILVQQCQTICEELVKRVLGPSAEPALNGVNQFIVTTFVLDAEELMCFIAELTSLAVKYRGKDKARLEKCLS